MNTSVVEVTKVTKRSNNFNTLAIVQKLDFRQQRVA